MKKISIIVPLGPKNKLDISDSLKKYAKDIELIVETGENPSKNRNSGAGKAGGDLIAFVNSHTIIPDGWVEEVRKFFSEHPEVDIVGGPQLNPKESSFFVKASGYCLGSVFSTANTSSRYAPGKLDLDADEKQLTSANLICRKAVLDKIKFDETLWPGEDPKFILDARKAGFKVAYSPDIFVFHKRRENLKDLSDQIMHYAMNRSGSLRKTVISNPLFLVPSLFLIYLFLVPLFFVLSLWLPGVIYFLFLGPLVLYIMLSVFFSFYESFRNNDPGSFFVLPLIFFIIQVSYGIGFIMGVRNGP